MIIKVCGLTPRTPLERLASLPIHWGGLIFVRDSPRFVGETPFELPASMERVGVFRDQLPSEIHHAVGRWKLDRIQLHGRETPAQVAELAACGCEVIKAIAVNNPRDIGRADRYAADYLLFDASFGGSGKKFDWAWLDEYTGKTPFILSGGIGPADAARIAELRHPRLAGFDLNSRFETAPGAKDPALLYEFLHHELPR